MDLRIFDLDGSLVTQPQLLRARPAIHCFRSWGPYVRLGCSFRRFEQFESAVAESLGSIHDTDPACTFIGSGDFHHVSLALLRRIEQPFNLLVLDNHPDWMRGIPFMHCGTWVHHASKLANVRTIFHVGGDVDFDNSFRWLAPWANLRSGKIQVISARRRFQRGAWADLGFSALRLKPDYPASADRIDYLVEGYQAELARWPLYISVDKDVLTARDAVVNWDSGHLAVAEVKSVLSAFIRAARRQIAGIDVVGDWSPVRLRGIGRRLLHGTEHPWLNVNPANATRCNQRFNLELLGWLSKLLFKSSLGADAVHPALAAL
jgi:hypothetical protein